MKSKIKIVIKSTPKFIRFIPVLLLILYVCLGSSCKVYKFNDVSLPPDSIKTVKISLIENRARYQNVTLAPKLTEKLRQKIVAQTRLSQTNNDADWELSGYVSDYSVVTSAISLKKEAANRLTVAVHIIFYNRKEDKQEEFDVARNFEFSANQSLQQAESALNDEIIRSLIDDIFNKLFSKW